MSRPNPYATDHLWSETTLAAFTSMPLYGGHAVALDYVHPRDIPAQEALWREWCRTRPRSLWSTWLDGWAERKKLRGLA